MSTAYEGNDIYNGGGSGGGMTFEWEDWTNKFTLNTSRFEYLDGSYILYQPDLKLLSINIKVRCSSSQPNIAAGSFYSFITYNGSEDIFTKKVYGKPTFTDYFANYNDFKPYDYNANGSLSGIVTNNYGSESTYPEKTDNQIDKKTLSVLMIASQVFPTNKSSGFSISMMVPVFQ